MNGNKHELINPEVIRPAISYRRGPALVKAGTLPGGLTVFDKGRVQELLVPVNNDCHARTIRVHEVLHANNSSPRKHKVQDVSSLTYNAVEDCFVHLNYW